jgi:hypothetical protein
VRDTKRLHFQVLALELGPHGELLPTLPESVDALAELSNHGWMVRHLKKRLKKILTKYISYTNSEQYMVL